MPMNNQVWTRNMTRNLPVVRYKPYKLHHCWKHPEELCCKLLLLGKLILLSGIFINPSLYDDDAMSRKYRVPRSSFRGPTSSSTTDPLGQYDMPWEHIRFTPRAPKCILRRLAGFPPFALKEGLKTKQLRPGRSKPLGPGQTNETHLLVDESWDGWKCTGRFENFEVGFKVQSS